MRFAIIENQKEDMLDITQCLPVAGREKYGYEKHGHGKSARECDANCEQYENLIFGEKVEFLIADILDLEVVDRDFDNPEVITAFKECMKALSRIYQKLIREYQCDLIIVTKIPASKLRKYFNENQDIVEIQALFPNAEELDEQLKQNNDSEFYLYLDDNITIVTKPYEVCEQNNPKIKHKINQWRNDLRALIGE